MTNRTQTLVGALALMAAAAIWGSMFVVSAAVLRVVPAFVLLELRFVIAFVLLAAVARFSGRRAVARRDLPLMALLGLVGYTICTGFQFVGTALSGAALGSLITAASPALIALFAVWLLGERVTARGILALGLGLGGVVVAVGLPSGEGGSLTGNIALALAALTWSAHTVLSRLGTRHYGSLTVTTWATLFGALFSLPIALHQQATQPWAGTPLIWLGIVYLGAVCTAAAFFLWNKGFEYLPAGSGGHFYLAQPLVGTLLGWALLDEQLTLGFFAGSVLIAAGVIVATTAR